MTLLGRSRTLEGMDPIRLLTVLSSRRLVLNESGGVAWNELLRSGTRYGLERVEDGDFSWQRKESFSRAEILELVETFDLVLEWFPGGVPVDVNHATWRGYVSPAETAAMAWIKSLRATPNDELPLEDNPELGISLEGELSFTERGAEAVRSGDFKYFSVEVLPAEYAANKLTGEAIGKPILTGGTLCNDPFWPGLNPLVAPAKEIDGLPIAASESAQVVRLRYSAARDDGGSTMKTIALAAILAALALDPEATEGDALAACSARGEESKVVGELVGERDELKRNLSEEKALSERILGERDTARARVTELEKEQAESLFAAFCKDGRAVPADKEDFLSVLSMTGGRERVGRVFSRGVNVVGDGHDGEGDEPRNEGDNPEQAFAREFDRVFAETADEGKAYSAAREKHGTALGGHYYKTGVHEDGAAS